MFDGLTKYLWGTDKADNSGNGNAAEVETIPVQQDVESNNRDDEVTTSEEDSKEQSVLNMRRKITIAISCIVILLALVSILMHSLALYHHDDIVVYFSTIIGILMSLSTIGGQYVLASIDTLRCVHNKIRMKVNEMMRENNKLQRTIHALESEVSRVKKIENELVRITKSSDQDVNKLIAAVAENEQIIKRQGQLARQAFQEQLLTSVLRTDRNGDMHITEQEVEVLIIRIKAQDGIRLDENKFRAQIRASNGSIWSIMTILNQISNQKQSDNWIIQADDSVLIRATKEN